MDICLYYKTIDAPWGGANSFIRALRDYLVKNGVTVRDGLDDEYKVLLLNGAYRAPGRLLDYSSIKSVKETGYAGLLKRILGRNRRVRIVYRLDGLRKIYAGIDTPMDDIQLKCMGLADHVIFQSRFSYECFARHGFCGDNYSVIHNGADQRIFNAKDLTSWDGKGKLRLVCYSWSGNPAKGHLTLSRLSELDDIEVDFAGNWPKDVPTKNVRITGPLEQAGLAGLMKRSHAFVFPSLHEACANSLLEALSCGLPVLYVDSGSNDEIAGRYGVKLRQEDFRSSIDELKARYPELAGKVKKDIFRFSIEYAGARYLEAIKKA